MVFNPLLIASLINAFVSIVIIPLFWALLLKIFARVNIRFTNIFELKAIEAFTIMIIFLLFSIMNQPLPSIWVKPSIESITFNTVILLLLYYIYHIENETALEKNNTIINNKYEILILSKIPRVLSIIIFGVLGLYFIYPSIILLEIVIIMLGYILFIAIVYIGLYNLYIIGKLLGLNIDFIYDESKNG
jgi:hypothetical protein